MPSDTSDNRDVQEAAEGAQEAAHGARPLSPAGKKKMQQGMDAPVPSPDQWPKSATTELGDASRAEAGAQKPEVKLHHETEGVDKEARPAGTPEGWRPGGPERG